MIDMKRAVVFVVMGGLSLTGAALLGGFNHNPANAAELNGFAINTQDKDKAVTITLFTDQRVPYATEHHGKQFTIVLPNTQISPEQMSNGLPVVVDNKNHFIGRAVPAEDGKVRIILPNLPASDYAVSIQQRRAVVKNLGDTAAKPRSATSLSNSNVFEQVVANIPKAKSGPRIAAKTTAAANAESPVLRLSSPEHHAEHPLIERGPNTRNMIWNPYATRAPKAVVAHEETTASKPSAAQVDPIHLTHVVPQASSLPFQGQPMPQMTANSSSGAPAQDPLWYLHSLPPGNPNAIPNADLKTLAAQDAQLQAATKPASAAQAKPATPAPQPSYIHGLLKELKASFKSIPQWILITIAVFLGGVGVFTLFGGLVLLKILFERTRPQALTQPILVMENPGNTATPEPSTASKPDKSPYATRPGHSFEDKSSISALDYLKGSPDSVATAVHNTTLLKFPTHRKHRSGLKKHVASATTGASSFKFSP